MAHLQLQIIVSTRMRWDLDRMKNVSIKVKRKKQTLKLSTIIIPSFACDITKYSSKMHNKNLTAVRNESFIDKSHRKKSVNTNQWSKSVSKQLSTKSDCAIIFRVGVQPCAGRRSLKKVFSLTEALIRPGISLLAFTSVCTYACVQYRPTFFHRVRKMQMHRFK